MFSEQDITVSNHPIHVYIHKELYQAVTHSTNPHTLQCYPKIMLLGVGLLDSRELESESCELLLPPFLAHSSAARTFARSDPAP